MTKFEGLGSNRRFLKLRFPNTEWAAEQRRNQAAAQRAAHFFGAARAKYVGRAFCAPGRRAREAAENAVRDIARGVGEAARTSADAGVRAARD